jgi:hypothetical protein
MAKRTGTKLETEDSNKLFEKIVKDTGIKIRELEVDNSWLVQLI